MVQGTLRPDRSRDARASAGQAVLQPRRRKGFRRRGRSSATSVQRLPQAGPVFRHVGGRDSRAGPLSRHVGARDSAIRAVLSMRAKKILRNSTVFGRKIEKGTARLLKMHSDSTLCCICLFCRRTCPAFPQVAIFIMHARETKRPSMSNHPVPFDDFLPTEGVFRQFFQIFQRR